MPKGSYLRRVTLKLESNVPLESFANSRFDTQSAHYLAMVNMKPGQSFSFPRTMANKIQSARTHAKRHMPDVEFAVRMVDKMTMRLWKLTEAQKKDNPYKGRSR